MKKFLALAFLFILANSIYSQDLIVTTSGDSINCKITKLKQENIYFTFKHKEEIRSTLLPMSNIKIHQFNYYQTSEVPKGKIIGFNNYKHVRLAINGGYSYHTASVGDGVPSDFNNYVNQLKSGYHIGGDFTYYFTEPLGVGFKYCVFKTSNSMDNIYRTDSYGYTTYGKMSDDLTISFAGPTFSTRILNSNKTNAFLTSLSMGYLSYSNNKVLIEKYKMTGSTVGLGLDIGYDIELSKNLSLGFQISFITGSLFKYELDNGVSIQTIELDNDEAENLNRIDFSVGLRFNK